MSYVIVGVHGLAPKPPRERLRGWWHDALIEGLRRNQGRTSNQPLNFEIAYYADVFAPPLEDDQEPYAVAPGEGRLPTYDDGWFDQLRARAFDTVGDAVDSVRALLGFEELSQRVLRRTTEDLFLYFTDPVKRDRVRQSLLDALEEPLHRQQRIMVVGHSMGSIVAYDVLRKLGRDRPGSVIQHFVTLGSPLGLPYVKFKLQEENDLVRTPSCVRRWTNLADRGDWVAFDTHLADDYEANNLGVKVEDDLVINGYVSPVTHEENAHKIYGYLRAPEVSAIVRPFV